MPVTINAIFDSPDEADFALMRLRDEKIDFKTCGMARVGEHGHNEHSGMGYIMSPYDVGLGYSMNENVGSGSLVRTQNFGGMLYTTVNSSVGGNTNPGEVMLSISVPDMQSKQAENMMISCHGRRIQIK